MVTQSALNAQRKTDSIPEPAPSDIEAAALVPEIMSALEPAPNPPTLPDGYALDDLKAAAKRNDLKMDNFVIAIKEGLTAVFPNSNNPDWRIRLQAVREGLTAFQILSSPKNLALIQQTNNYPVIRDETAVKRVCDTMQKLLTVNKTVPYVRPMKSQVQDGE